MNSRTPHINMPKHPLVCPGARRPRRGSATLWMVIWLPCLLALFVSLVGVANLWLARVELENALEASALAAVKQWGDVGGGDTLIPRQVGVEYAEANSLRGTSLVINTNYDAAQPPNQNADCDLAMTPPTANLIFGAIDDSNANNVIFNAGLVPSCGFGQVLLDATDNGGEGGQGGGGGGSQAKLAKENAWGISFYRNPELPAGLRIDRILINLRGGGGNGVWVGNEQIDAVDPMNGWAMRDQSGPLQPDYRGFTDILDQVEFNNLGNGLLEILFHPDNDPSGGTDAGFSPGDRLRFGYDVDNVSSGSGADGADGIGRDRVTATIFFSINGVPVPLAATGTFADSTFGKNNCLDTAVFNTTTQSYAVVPDPVKLPGQTPIPDLPCPPTAAQNNDGQSFVLVSGLAPRKFGVRAQAMAPIRPLGGVPFVGTLTQQCVQAKATAEYDCLTRKVRLIRIDTFICPGP